VKFGGEMAIYKMNKGYSGSFCAIQVEVSGRKEFFIAKRQVERDEEKA
jgi:hypothetical protein